MIGLRLVSVTSGYGRMDVLRDIDLEVRPGEIVALVGRNGAGKSTLLRTIAGLQRVRHGEVTLASATISDQPAWKIARMGVAMVLEGARVFGSQTVADYITAGLMNSRDRVAGQRRVDLLLDTFPILREKAASPAMALSGGERMQLAIVQALAASPRYLLLDEPSVGLAPAVVRTVFDLIDGIRKEGDDEARLGILVAEQMVAPVLRVADRAVVLDQGAVVARGSAADLRDNPALIDAYLGASG